ncbi:xylose-responsive transcription regulator, ROK family [Lachnospiraceae bacterium KM106-2]|nr:xylose-responsive transcription regulator, ROK family [Lachnospiraceae bacterium KM106-2]
MCIGNGIGVGVVIDGKLYRGNNGYACEAGHMSINYNGERCSCGNRGCYELYATEGRLLKKSKSKDVRDMMNKYVHKDPLTIRVMDEFIQVTSIAMTNLINIFDPECIIVGSSAASFHKNIIKQIEYLVNLSCIQRRQKYIKVSASNLKDTSIVIGAGSIVFDQLLEGKIALL